MRILMITQFFRPDITAAAFRLTDFARLFAQDGHQVQVITAYPHKAQVSAVDDTSLAAEGIQVRRCRVREVVGRGARAYLRHYLSFVAGSLRAGWGIWWSGWRPDVIYVSSPPLFVGISGRLLSWLFRRPMVFEVRDIWPDAAVATGQLSAGGLGYRLGRQLERYLYAQARHITCVAQPMKRYLEQQTRVPVTVAYNGVPDEALALTEALPGAPLGQPGSRRTLLYAGNVGHAQELDLLIRGLGQLHAQGQADHWQLQILGEGAQKPALQELVRQLGAEAWVTFLPAVEREEAYRAMQRADLLYLNLKRDPTLEKTIPSKLFDYLLAARPIVAGLAGEGKQILDATGANLCFEPGEVDQLKETLVQAFARLPELEQRAAENRAVVLQRFTRRRAADTVLAVFRTVVSSDLTLAAERQALERSC